MGNRARVVDAAGTTTTYGYDRAYQLTSDDGASSSGFGWSDMTLSDWSNMTLDQWANLGLNGAPASNAYRYDPVGNRVGVTRTDGSRITFTYDAANQLTRVLEAGVPTTLTYDAAGNPLTQRNTTQPFNVTMTWDAENRLATYHQAGVSGGNAFDQQLTHAYNGDGLRVERQGFPHDARFVWDGQNIHLKLNLSNVLLDNFQYEFCSDGFGNLICNSTPYFNLYNFLGSTTGLSLAARWRPSSTMEVGAS